MANETHKDAPRKWRFQDREKCRTLWLDCLLLSRLSSPPESPAMYPQLLAEAAFAAAWAAVDFWDIPDEHRARLQARLSRTSSFLETLRPERSRPGIAELRQRLSRICGQAGMRTEIWAYLIGHWLQYSGKTASMEELADMGWPAASFGLGFWSGASAFYRKNGKILPLVQPYSRSDAFDLFGPFEKVSDDMVLPRGETIILASLGKTAGLKSPDIWRTESLLGGIPGVLRTRLGHVHRQFAAESLPEWFEAVEVVFEPSVVGLEKILLTFWESYYHGGDLVFWTDPDQEAKVERAWRVFAANKPAWAVPEAPPIHSCNWFDPAPAKNQKADLRERVTLRSVFQRIDLGSSHLATKVNAFAAGFGSDEEVVLLCARYGLSDGLTLALRVMRYFGRNAEGA